MAGDMVAQGKGKILRRPRIMIAFNKRAMRRLIEDMGTTNFPTAGGKKLYGELTMLITVNYDGQVVATEVVESSGNTVLDRRARGSSRATARPAES